MRIVAHKVLVTSLSGTLKVETFEIEIVVVVSIIEHSCPDLGFVKLLYAQQSRAFVVVVGVEIGGIEITIFQHNQYHIFAMEFTKIVTAFIKIEPLHVVVEPHFSSSQRGTSVRFEGDFMHIESSEEITARTTTFHCEFAERFFKRDATQFGIGFQSDLDGFGFPIGVGGEIVNSRAGFALRCIVFAIVDDTRHIETLHIVRTVYSIAISHIVDRALVVLFENGNVHNFSFLVVGFGAFGFANVNFFGYSGYLVGAIAIEDDDIVDAGAVFHKFVLFQGGSHKSISTIDIEFLVGFHHFSSFDGVEGANFCAARMFGSISVVDGGEPIDGDIGEMGKVVVNLR